MGRFTKIRLGSLNNVVFDSESRMFLKRMISCQTFSIIRSWSHQVCLFRQNKQLQKVYAEN